MTAAIHALLLGLIAFSPPRPVHHYVFVGRDRQKLTDSSFLATKALEGAQVSYSWRELEPGKDEYDFAPIRDDLKFLQSRGKKLFIQLQDVTFSGDRPEHRQARSDLRAREVRDGVSERRLHLLGHPGALLLRSGDTVHGCARHVRV
jgi:hypothetical protein